MWEAKETKSGNGGFNIIRRFDKKQTFSALGNGFHLRKAKPSMLAYVTSHRYLRWAGVLGGHAGQCRVTAEPGRHADLFLAGWGLAEDLTGEGDVLALGDYWLGYELLCNTQTLVASGSRLITDPSRVCLAEGSACS